MVRIRDVIGATRLATQATLKTTTIVEAVHQSVWSTLGFPAGDATGRTRGLTGLVYRTIEQVARRTGQSAEALLLALQPEPGPANSPVPSSPRRDTLLSALNGMIGDQLADNDNPLAIAMKLRPDGSRPASGKVLLLVHGLCMTDFQQYAQNKQHDIELGSSLADALGYSPVYLRYNSGRHISQNGRELSLQLEKFLHDWPCEVQSLDVVAHSMGGLVMRSAVHYGQQAGLSWPRLLKNLVFLGTPHHGAPLEKMGHWLAQALDATPYSRPFTQLTNLRSAGISDLRHGHLLDEDWTDENGSTRQSEKPATPGLPEQVSCFAVAGCLGTGSSLLHDRLIGDGLVPIRSALGLHDNEHQSLAFPTESQWLAPQTGHMELLNSPAVARQLVRWL